MKLFPNRERRDQADRLGMIEELQRVMRRMRALPLAAPVLLLMGFGFGQVTNRGLSVPGDGAVRETTEKGVPRVHLEALSRRMQSMNVDGRNTVEYVRMYREHVAP